MLRASCFSSSATKIVNFYFSPLFVVFLTTTFTQASTLSAQIGYGNAAGFLFSKGMMAPPSDETDANGVPLNPITGTTRRREPSTVDMTNEEKEREAERLFVLFDRLERSGMGVNPVRAAMQEGRFEELPEDPEDD